MQKTMPKLGVGSVLGLCMLAGVLSLAEAAIKIDIAEVQDGEAYIEGNGAVPGAQIFWEGGLVTTANTVNGGFEFFGVLPADCRGELSDGAETVPVDVLGCTPDAAGAPAPVAVTGQTDSFGTRDDGAIQAGVPFPSPRFTDNGDGTVTDNLTGLIWLKNANYFGFQTWANALNAANGLADGQCGLSDGSVAGDWYLPNVKELQSLIDYGIRDPAVPSGHPFSGVASAPYWSSTTVAPGPGGAWFIILVNGLTSNSDKDATDVRVWPVRGAKGWWTNSASSRHHRHGYKLHDPRCLET